MNSEVQVASLGLKAYSHLPQRAMDQGPLFSLVTSVSSTLPKSGNGAALGPSEGSMARCAE